MIEVRFPKKVAFVRFHEIGQSDFCEDGVWSDYLAQNVVKTFLGQCEQILTPKKRSEGYVHNPSRKAAHMPTSVSNQGDFGELDRFCEQMELIAPKGLPSWRQVLTPIGRSLSAAELALNNGPSHGQAILFPSSPLFPS